MNKEAAGKRKSAKSRSPRAIANGKARGGLTERAKEGLAAVDSLLPAGSPQRDAAAAAGVAGAAVGVLLLAAKFGVGPTVLAVAAGYLAYCAASGSEEGQRAGLKLIDTVLRGRE
jgi:hypothetical protein